MKRIGLIRGDGIGSEISNCVEKIFNKMKLPLAVVDINLGVQNLEKGKELIPDDEVEKMKYCDAILKAPLMTPIGEGFSSVNVSLRKLLNLDINYRPVKTIEGIDTPFQNVDIITIRENTQGMYGGEGQIFDGETAKATSVMNKTKLESFFRRSFELLIKKGRRNVVISHKANILKTTSGLFLKTGLEIAKEYPELNVTDMIVDATAMNLVKTPERFDSIITSNLFGDILSDLCAGLVGGLGVASGANLGANTAIFEAVHGTAPDIEGKNLANPTAFIYTACLMLDFLELNEEADLIRDVLNKALSQKETRTGDLGGYTNSV